MADLQVTPYLNIEVVLCPEGSVHLSKAIFPVNGLRVVG